MFNGESQGKRQVLNITCRELELNFVKPSFYFKPKSKAERKQLDHRQLLRPLLDVFGGVGMESAVVVEKK